MCRILESADYEVRVAADGPEALAILFNWRPDLVVLDIAMPKMSGWQVLQRIRQLTTTPVILLSALSQEQEKVRGLRSGADDYVAKPFGKHELLARVEAVLRRAQKPDESEAVFQDSVLSLDLERHRVHVRGSPVDLSPLEFRVLAALIQNADAVLSQSRLLELCWMDRIAGPTNVRMCIAALRRKIEADPKQPELIETVREFGYRYKLTGPAAD